MRPLLEMKSVVFGPDNRIFPGSVSHVAEGSSFDCTLKLQLTLTLIFDQGSALGMSTSSGECHCQNWLGQMAVSLQNQTLASEQAMRISLNTI